MMPTPRFGRMQLKIMQVLWRRGRASARQVTADLNRDEEVAHSTVQTLLRKLERKGAVAHDIDDRTFVFYALTKPQPVTRSVTRDLIERVFGGSAAGLVAYVLQHERIRKEELDELRRLIRAEED